MPPFKVRTACQCRIATCWHQTEPVISKAHQCSAMQMASGRNMASGKAQMTKLQLTLLGPSKLSCALPTDKGR